MKLLVLFFAPFIAGLSARAVTRLEDNTFRNALIFAGSYLIAITVLHLLHALTERQLEIKWVMVLMIVGFVIPHLLDYTISEGKHMYTTSLALVPLLFALCTHAFLEGAMIARPLLQTAVSTNTLLLGIILHRIPVAFALVVMLSRHIQSRKHILFYLLIFSLSAPLGGWVSEYVMKTDLVSETLIVFLYAIMGGSFLQLCLAHLLVKNQPLHLRKRKIAIAILGLLTGVAIESVF